MTVTIIFRLHNSAPAIYNGQREKLMKTHYRTYFADLILIQRIRQNNSYKNIQNLRVSRNKTGIFKVTILAFENTPTIVESTIS